MIVNEEADLVPAGENDIRITRIGKFLRDNYLDELPNSLMFYGAICLLLARAHT